MRCRHCHSSSLHLFLDLGFAPPSNAYLSEADLKKPENYFPLKVMVCDQCWLVQTEDFVGASELFSADYAYFSSTSTSWLEHAKQYASQIIERLVLDESSLVIEVASNDGYLLKNFVGAGIPSLGIEPTASTAIAAESVGVPVLREFFGEALGKKLAHEGRRADLIVGNNVYAHVPEINDNVMCQGYGYFQKNGSSASYTLEIDLDFFEDINFNFKLAFAAASLIMPRELTKDLVNGKSILIPLIGKLLIAL